MRNLYFLLLLIPIQLFSQTIEIINHSGFKPDFELNDNLNLLANDSLLNDLEFVAKIKGKDNEIHRLYWTMHNASTSEGANIYKFSKFEIDSLNQTFYCEWELYYCNDSIQKLNFLLNNNSTIYVFSSSKPITSFKANGKNQTLKPMEYYSVSLNKGDELKINKGGLIGMTFFYKWKQSKVNGYLRIGGGSFGPYSSNTTSGVSITTGSLEKVDRELGVFLSNIYKKK